MNSLAIELYYFLELLGPLVVAGTAVTRGPTIGSRNYKVQPSVPEQLKFDRRFPNFLGPIDHTAASILNNA